MKTLPRPLRRFLGAACLAWPLVLGLGPFPFLRIVVMGLMALLAVTLFILSGTGLEGDLAWRLLFRLLEPLAWMAPDPGRWWLDFARRCEDTRLIEGALDRGEAWGSDEAAFEIALNRLSSGVTGIQQGGVLRLKALASRGHRESMEALAACMAWGLGTAQDSTGARTLWMRLGGHEAEDIPLPRPGLLRRAAARPEEKLIAGLSAQLNQAGEATRGLLMRSAPARAGLWIGALALLLFLLAIPITFVLSNLAQGGVVGQASTLILLIVGVGISPALLMLLVMALSQRASTHGSTAARRLRRRAESGDPEACFKVGEDFDRGAPHAPRDLVEARRWYRAAAEQGHAEAAYRLAELLILGFGGPKDRSEGLEWLRRAAEAGHAGAGGKLAEYQGSGNEANQR